jgi:hemerythrin superfamily protein
LESAIERVAIRSGVALRDEASSYSRCSAVRTTSRAFVPYSFALDIPTARGSPMFGMTSSESTNAIDLLKRDHDDVDKLFSQYEDIKDGDDSREKELLVAQICDALSVHAQIEEELFYPAARSALDQDEGKDLIDEAAVEHQTLKDLIARLEQAPTDDPLYDAGVKVLSEYVKHHVKEEENELFPKCKSSPMDLDAVGAQLAERKAALTRQASRQGRKTTNGQQRGARASVGDR